jgi:hypothetical protein
LHHFLHPSADSRQSLMKICAHTTKIQEISTPFPSANATTSGPPHPAKIPNKTPFKSKR